MGAAESVVRKAVKTAAGLAARRAVEAPGPAARLYGGSLYELAAGEDLAQTIMEELRLVWQLFKENPSYRKLLKEPSILLAQRIALLDSAFGGQIHPYLLNFLKLLCEKGMIMELGGCCREYRAHFYEDNDMASAFVTSAVALTGGQAAALKTRLESLTGKKILLTQKVDESLLGGLKVEFEEKRLDGTLRERLNVLGRRIAEITI